MARLKRDLTHLLTTQDVARELGRGERWVLRQAVAKKIPCYETRLGRLFDPEVVELLRSSS